MVPLAQNSSDYYNDIHRSKCPSKKTAHGYKKTQQMKPFLKKLCSVEVLSVLMKEMKKDVASKSARLENE
uniref:Ovule protein n=1 Tax=Strongyloides venezuelensis TaxID=75913 RepID=A0A0K0FRR9_STRVS